VELGFHDHPTPLVTRRPLERHHQLNSRSAPPARIGAEPSRFQLKAEQEIRNVLGSGQVGDLGSLPGMPRIGSRPTLTGGGDHLQVKVVSISVLPASPGSKQQTSFGLMGASQRTGPAKPSMRWPFKTAPQLSSTSNPLITHIRHHGISAVEQRITDFVGSKHCRCLETKGLRS